MLAEQGFKHKLFTAFALLKLRKFHVATRVCALIKPHDKRITIAGTNCETADAMSIVIEFIHLVIAGVLSLSGLAYERSEECDSVLYMPATFEYVHNQDANDLANTEFSQCAANFDHLQVQTL